jgi:hypothetical protein
MMNMSDGKKEEAPMDKVTESEARKEALAAEADGRVKSGAHWSDWRYIADGFAVGQAKAMREAGTNRPYGKGFTRAFGAWMNDPQRPWARRYDKVTRSHLIWVADHSSEIEEWRDTLAQNEKDKLNHPTTIKRKYEAAHKVVANDPNAPKKETPREALVKALDEANAEIQRLRRARDDGGSLCDFRDDPLPMIAKIMGEQMGLQRLTSAQQAIAAEIKRLKALYKGKAQAG